MKVRMYLDLFENDIINNKKMLMAQEWWAINATNNPPSKMEGQARIAFTIDIPDKYFMEFEDYVTGDAVLEVSDED